MNTSIDLGAPHLAFEMWETEFSLPPKRQPAGAVRIGPQ